MFKNIPQNNLPIEETPETGYKKAQDEFTKTIGTAKAAAANWRMMAFGLLAFSLLSLASLIFFATRSTVVPYIVEVDSKNGAVLSTSKVYANSQAGQKEIEYFIWQIVKKTRTLPKDIVLYDNNWKEVYAFMDAQTSQKFNDMAIRENHKDKLENGITTMLNLKSITPLSNQENTYNIRWTESKYENDGKVSGEYELEGFFSIQQGEVNEKTVFINPLGLKIIDFSISQVQ